MGLVQLALAVSRLLVMARGRLTGGLATLLGRLGTLARLIGGAGVFLRGRRVLASGLALDPGLTAQIARPRGFGVGLLAVPRGLPAKPGALLPLRLCAALRDERESDQRQHH